MPQTNSLDELDRQAAQQNEPRPLRQQFADRTAEFIQGLTSEVDMTHKQEDFQRLLGVMSKFHKYSLGNQILIAIQRPDATRVAGLKKWNELGRRVLKGESAIYVWAPDDSRKSAKFQKRKSAEQVRDIPLAAVLERFGVDSRGYKIEGNQFRELGTKKTGRGAIDLVMTLSGGKMKASEAIAWLKRNFADELGGGRGEAARLDAATQNESRTPRSRASRFKLVPVFDISQTEGPPLPCDEMMYANCDNAAYQTLIKAATQALEKLGVEVVPSPKPIIRLTQEMLGFMQVRKGLGPLVSYYTGMSLADQFATLIHEGAHAVLHAKAGPAADSRAEVQEAVKEIEAESTAYVVCQYFGVPSTAPLYLALALGGTERAGDIIKSCLKNINRAAAQLVQGMEDVLTAERVFGATQEAANTDDLDFDPFGAAEEPELLNPFALPEQVSQPVPAAGPVTASKPNSDWNASGLSF